METKYYFILYEVKKCGWKPIELGGTSTGMNLMKCQGVINIHPLQFQLECNEKYNKERPDNGGYITKEEYTVLSWQSLTKAEYLKFKDHIG